jgi:hypothetical protein
MYQKRQTSRDRSATIFVLRTSSLPPIRLVDFVPPSPAKVDASELAKVFSPQRAVELSGRIDFMS